MFSKEKTLVVALGLAGSMVMGTAPFISASPAAEATDLLQFEERQFFVYERTGEEISFSRLNLSEAKATGEMGYRISDDGNATYSLFSTEGEVREFYLSSVVDTDATQASSHGFAILPNDLKTVEVEDDIIEMEPVPSLSSLGVEIRSENRQEKLQLGYTWDAGEIPAWMEVRNDTFVSEPVPLSGHFDRVSSSTLPLPFSPEPQSSCPEKVDHGTVYAHSGDNYYVDIYANLYTNRQSTYPCFSTSSFYASTNPSDRWIEGRGGSGTGDISWADMRLFTEDKSEVIDVSDVDCSQSSGAGNLYCSNQGSWSTTKIEGGYAEGDTFTRWGGLTVGQTYHYRLTAKGGDGVETHKWKEVSG